MISGLFIARPRLAIVLSLLLLVGGAIAIATIAVAQYPSIAPPTVQVGAVYPGASAEVVEQSLAQPLESAINGVPGMKYMSSLSSDGGGYGLTISFAVGTDVDDAASEVQDRIGRVSATLPASTLRDGVSVTKSGEDLLQVFAVHNAPGGRFDELALSTYVTLNILDALRRIDGVGSVTLFGGRDTAMRIWVEPQRMARLGLTVAETVAAVAAANAQAAAGSIGSPPAPSGQLEELPVAARGRLSTPEEFGAVLLRADRAGGSVRVADVATVELGAADASSAARFAGGAAVAIGLYLSPGANAVNVAAAAEAEIARISARFPPGLAVTKILDGADFINAMIATVVETLLVAFALVAAVVFLFLGRVKAALIPLVAAPVAIVGAVAVLAAFGSSANAITLLALVLAIGIVVDDAIIVVENVERVMAEAPGLSAAEATGRAMAEITPSIVAITLVLLSVFVPVAFLPGATGVLFAEFATAVAAAVVISALIALTLSPALAAAVLRPGAPLRLVRPVTLAVDLLARGAATLVRRLVPVAWLALVALAGIGLATADLYLRVPKSYVPDEDKGYVFVVMSLPPGAALERTAAAGAAAEAVVAADPAVAGVTSVLGIDFIGGGAASNGGVLFVKLKDYAARTAPDLSAFATVARLRTALAALPEAVFMAVNPPAIDGLGRVGGLEYVLKAEDGQAVADLDAVARHLAIAARGRPEIAALFAGGGSQIPLVWLDVDRTRAAELGIALNDVFTTLGVMIGGAIVDDFNLYGRNWTIRMQAEASARATVDDVLALQVRTAGGALVPISTIATADVRVGPRTVARYDNVRSLTLNAVVAPGRGTGDAIAALEALSATALPPGYGYEWTGQALEEKEAAGETLLVVGLAILFAYLFLVAFYESFLVPVAVLLSVAVAVAGALLGLALTGLSLGVYAEIGIVILIALAAKNAILVVSFALQAKAAGMSLAAATAEGVRLRFRPVMMTSVAFIAGLVPLALATGPGAGAMRAVGVPVLAGMLAASTIGFLLVPLLFFCFDRAGERLARRAASPPAAARET